ncbi:MAG: hypothetical protein EHM12_02235 [Dehalococcoidia bacterium]|nr:MAG: hypothetical protein EHM12_02235 [Dehalococcoidia bacterium]
MNKTVLILLAISLILSGLIIPFSVSADDNDLLTKEENGFDLLLFIKADRASRYIDTLRGWLEDCSSKMKFIFQPGSITFPEKEFTEYKTCFFGDQGANVPDTMKDIAALWDAEVCLKFDAISRRMNSLKKSSNPWDWATGLEEIKGNLADIESALPNIKAMQKKRVLELKTKRKLEQEAKKEAGLKDDFCFIATAAYGTPAAVEIGILRRFRDECLQNNLFGRAFITFYYNVSPPIAGCISEHEVLRTIARESFIEPVVKVLELTEHGWSDKARCAGE